MDHNATTVSLQRGHRVGRTTVHVQSGNSGWCFEIDGATSASAALAHLLTILSEASAIDYSDQRDARP